MKNLYVISKKRDGNRSSKMIFKSDDFAAISAELVNYAKLDGAQYLKDVNVEEYNDIIDAAKNGSYSYDVFNYQIDDYLNFYEYELNAEKSDFEKAINQDNFLAEDDFFSDHFPLSNDYLMGTSTGTSFEDFEVFFKNINR